MERGRGRVYKKREEGGRKRKRVPHGGRDGQDGMKTERKDKTELRKIVVKRCKEGKAE